MQTKINPVRNSAHWGRFVKGKISNGMNRRQFIKALSAGAVSLALPGCVNPGEMNPSKGKE